MSSSSSKPKPKQNRFQRQMNPAFAKAHGIVLSTTTTTTTTTTKNEESKKKKENPTSSLSSSSASMNTTNTNRNTTSTTTNTTKSRITNNSTTSTNTNTNNKKLVIENILRNARDNGKLKACNIGLSKLNDSFFTTLQQEQPTIDYSMDSSSSCNYNNGSYIAETITSIDFSDNPLLFASSTTTTNNNNSKSSTNTTTKTTTNNNTNTNNTNNERIWTHYKNIQRMYLKRCNIVKLPSLLLYNNLILLDLIGNKLNEFHFYNILSCCNTCIREVLLSSNTIQSFNFTNTNTNTNNETSSSTSPSPPLILKSLIKLDISNNQLTILPWKTQLITPNLQYFDCSNNQLSNLIILDDDNNNNNNNQNNTTNNNNDNDDCCFLITSKSSLITLDGSNNKIKGYLPNTTDNQSCINLSSFEKLQTLLLHNNQLKYIPCISFIFGGPTQISLTDNYIQTIKGLFPPTTATTITNNNNNTKTTTTTITKVKQLFIQNNKLIDLDIITIQHLCKSIERFNIYNNYIKYIPYQLVYCTKLQYINIHANPIVNIKSSIIEQSIDDITILLTLLQQRIPNTNTNTNTTTSTSTNTNNNTNNNKETSKQSSASTKPTTTTTTSTKTTTAATPTPTTTTSSKLITSVLKRNGTILDFTKQQQQQQTTISKSLSPSKRHNRYSNNNNSNNNNNTERVQNVYNELQNNLNIIDNNKIIQLILSNNSLHTIYDEWITIVPNLITLDLSHNILGGVSSKKSNCLPNNILLKCNKLQNLYLRQNQLCGICLKSSLLVSSSSSSTNTNTLQVLDLSCNQLGKNKNNSNNNNDNDNTYDDYDSFILSQLLKQCTNLKELNLSNNCLTSIDTWKYIPPTLEILNLSNNNISTISNVIPIYFAASTTTTISSFTSSTMNSNNNNINNLKYISLLQNNLKSIPYTFGLLKLSSPLLTYLDLRNNPQHLIRSTMIEKGIKSSSSSSDGSGCNELLNYLCNRMTKEQYNNSINQLQQIIKQQQQQQPQIATMNLSSSSSPPPSVTPVLSTTTTTSSNSQEKYNNNSSSIGQSKNDEKGSTINNNSTSQTKTSNTRNTSTDDNKMTTTTTTMTTKAATTTSDRTTTNNNNSNSGAGTTTTTTTTTTNNNNNDNDNDNDNTTSSPYINELKQNIQKISNELDTSFSLSNAKRYALKKQLAMERSKLIREERKLKENKN